MSQARVTAFHNLLKDIINIVSGKFPEDRDLEYARSQLELSLSVSARITVSSFMEGVTPFLDKIYHKDEAFFIDFSNNDEILSEMKLGEKWIQLDASEKEKLWKNVQKLVVLGNKILEE